MCFNEVIFGSPEGQKVAICGHEAVGPDLGTTLSWAEMSSFGAISMSLSEHQSFRFRL